MAGHVYALLFLLIVITAQQQQQPRYCVDPNVLSIFSRRLQQCNVSASSLIDEELEFVRRTNAIEFQRAHEIIAYHWLVIADNPYRVPDCADADLEYIPLLPLSWRVQAKASQPSECTYRALIDLILAYLAYRKNASASASGANSRLRFAVASTFNLRTEMGSGMRGNQRRGEEYDLITSFVSSLYVGHYERWPQCPDLLRKGWSGIIELPYLSLTTADDSTTTAPTTPKPNTFLFAGRINQLYGPELVCSVRTAMIGLFRLASDSRAASNSSARGFKLFNVTNSDLARGVQKRIVSEFESAVFCLVTKADSYSSGSLYTAIQSDCIPVIISDWFVFAFPWAIPYNLFVVRFSESHWLMNPEACLDYLRAIPESEREKKRQAMRKYRELLSFHTRPAGAPATRGLRELWMREQRLLPRDTTPSVSPSQTVGASSQTVLALELMLYELKFFRLHPAASAAQGQGKPMAAISPTSNQIWSCLTPFHCASNQTDFSGTIAPPVAMPGITNTRSYLCTHSHRLIGMYKMVFFMGCVRILWPLRPGVLKVQDVKFLSPSEKVFVESFHNVTARAKDWVLQPYHSR